MKSLPRKRILVLGGYGFIGSAISKRLNQSHEVSCFGRSRSVSAKVCPSIPFVEGDLKDFQDAEKWRAVIEDFDVVVNCAGVLQETKSGELDIVHNTALKSLAEACASTGLSVVQISAVGATLDSAHSFLRSKAQGDQSLANSGCKYWILRPGLVIGRESFGGTRLIRMLASVPWVQPIAYASAPVQSVALCELVSIVEDAISDRLPQGAYDVVEAAPQSLENVVAQTRSAMGFTPAKLTVRLPQRAFKPLVWIADMLGHLRWRSPLSTAAIEVLRDGIVGDPMPLQQVRGSHVSGLSSIFRLYPIDGSQRIVARLSLLMPAVVTCLSAFWLFSGLIGLLFMQEAAHLLKETGWSTVSAMLSVVLWSLVDICLGLAILWRPWAQKACLLMALVCVVYLLSAIVFVPYLLLDPLGPIVKILPALFLVLLTHSLLEPR